MEYQIEGISQTQVNPKIDLTFASGLRSFLRHDPDVIMVGEIRDLETAEIAIQASLTGHLVFSTLHTNDAAGAITRLVDMEVEPFLVASSVIGADGPAPGAQGLPRVQEAAAAPPRRSWPAWASPPEEFSRRRRARTTGFSDPDAPAAAAGDGLPGRRAAPACMSTGYTGRTRDLRAAADRRRRSAQLVLAEHRRQQRSSGWRWSRA